MNPAPLIPSGGLRSGAWSVRACISLLSEGGRICFVTGASRDPRIVIFEIRRTFPNDPAMHPRRLLILPLVALLGHATAATVTWTGPTTGQPSWSEPSNWSVQRVPASADDVVIDAAGDFTVILRNVDVVVQRIVSGRRLRMESASLTVSAGASALGGGVVLTNATLVARNPGTVLEATGPSSVARSNLRAIGGATLAMPGLSELVGGALGVNLVVQAEGEGSVLDFPNLTVLTGLEGQFTSFALGAVGGGRFLAPKLESTGDGILNWLASGSNSLVQLPSLRSVRGGKYDAAAGGRIEFPALTAVTNASLVVRTGGTLTTESVRHLLLSSVGVYGGAVLRFPVLESYAAGTVNSATLEAWDASSVLDLGAVRSLTGAENRFAQLTILAQRGGRIILTNLQGHVAGTTRIRAEGVSSRIELDAFRTLGSGSLETSTGGSLHLPSLDTVTNSSLSIGGAGAFNTLTITRLAGANLGVGGAAVVRFPQIERFDSEPSPSGVTWEVTDAGSVLEFPALQTYVGALKPFARSDIRAVRGGRLRVPRVGTLGEGAFGVLVEGAGSTLEAPLLTRIHGGIHVVAFGGRFDAPLLAAVENASLTLRGESTFPLGTIASIFNASLFVQNGAKAAFPAVTSYQSSPTGPGTTLESSGAGSRLEFPALNRYVGSTAPFTRSDLRATGGATLAMPQIRSLGEGSFGVLAEGVNSVIEAPNLTRIDGGLFDIRSGARVEASLNEIRSASLGVSGAGTRIDVANVSTLLDTSLAVAAGAVLRLPKVTTLEHFSTSRGTTIDCSGAGSVLEFPSLTRYVGATAPFTQSTLVAQNGGIIRLPIVTTMGQGSFQASAFGTGARLELPNLRSILGSAWNVAGGGLLQMPNLVEIADAELNCRHPGSQLTLDNVIALARTSASALDGGVIRFPALIAYDGGSLRVSPLLQAIGAGSLLDLSALRQFSGVDAAFASVRVSVSGGGVVLLDGVGAIDRGFVGLSSAGADSRISLSSLATLRAARIEVFSGGQFNAPRLESLEGSFVQIAHAGSSALLPSLVTAVNSRFQVNTSRLELPVLEDTRGTFFDALEGGSFQFPPAANLRVTGIVAPPASLGGAPVTLVWSVTNASATAISGTRQDGIALRRDGTPDIPLGDVRVDSTLPANGARSHTNLVIIPGGLTGVWRFVVSADSGYEVYEGTNESDNTLVDDLPIGLASPDLLVHSPSLDRTTLPFGGSVNVTWSVRNQGSTNATARWIDRIWFSPDGTNLAGATLLATIPAVSTLAPDASYTNRASVVLPLPPGARPGTAFIVIRTDATDAQFESNESNNGAAVPADITLPPRPDLAVRSLLHPAEFVAGTSAKIHLDIENVGAAGADGRIRASYSLQYPSQPDQPLELGTTFVDNRIGTGAVLGIDFDLALPANLPAGSGARLVATLNPDGEIPESRTDNNLATSPVTITVPAILSLVATPTSIPENSGMLTARLGRNTPSDAPQSVSFRSSHPLLVSAPPTVVIPAGQSFVPVPLTVGTDGLANDRIPVTITAESTGSRTASLVLSVENTDPPRLLLTLETNRMTEGTTLVARISRNGLPSLPLEVRFATDSPHRLLPPATVTLAPQQRTATFAVIALDDTLISPPQVFTLSAGAPGYPETTAEIEVLDDDLPTLTLELPRPTVAENATVTARLARLGDTRAPLVVRLTSSAPSTLPVPETVVIPEGEHDTAVPLTPLDNASVDGSRAVQISAVPTFTVTGEPAAAPVSRSITVTDDDGPSLVLALDRTVVGEGLARAAQLTVRRNSGRATPLTVRLSSSSPAQATLPPTAVIPAGADTVAVDVATLPVPGANGSREITLTASADGIAAGTTFLMVTDIASPDFATLDVTTPASATTRSTASIGWRMFNQGLATASGAFHQALYLSTNRVWDLDDTLVAEQSIEGQLPPGESISFVRSIFLPGEPGDYWIIVRSDPADDIVEIREDNNLAVSPAPIRVLPAYEAVDVDAGAEIAGGADPVVIRGRLIRTDDRSPAAFEVAAIHLSRDCVGAPLILGGLSDLNGRFEVQFRPGANDAGRYCVSAGHPEVTTLPVADQFTLVGLAVETNLPIRLTLSEGEVLQVNVPFRALGGVTLSGLTATLLDLPGSVGGSVDVPSLLAANGAASARIRLESRSGSAGRFSCLLRITGDHGLQRDVQLGLDIRPPSAVLAVTPPAIEAGAVLGGITQIVLGITNAGNAASGPIHLSLPDAAWLGSVDHFPLPSLEPGAGTTLTLRLTPGSDLPLQRYRGELGIVTERAGTRVPFSIRTVSEALGDLEVTAEDEFTYYVAGAPRVAGARVMLLDAFDHSRVVREATTGTNGMATFTGVPEGPYWLRVVATKHTSRELRVDVATGITRRTRVLLPSETVTYSWTVEPTEVADRYHVTLDTRFEANVPFPVVTADPPIAFPAVFPGEATRIQITYTNHGLITAKGIVLRPRNTPTWKITPLFTDLGDLPARSSITVPVLIEHQPDVDAAYLARLRELGRLPAGIAPSPRSGNPALADGGGGGGGGNKECGPPELDALYFVICGPDGVFHTINIPLQPFSMLKDAYGCLKAVAGLAAGGAGAAAGAGAACDCASTIATLLGGEVPPQIKCFCAFLGGDGGGIAKCLCPEIPPGEPGDFGTAVFSGAFQPIAPPPGNGGGNCSLIPTGGGGGSGTPLALMRIDGGLTVQPTRVRPAPHSPPATSSTTSAHLADAGSKGICATVRLRMEQDLVLTRSGFHATLGIDNREATTLDHLRFRIDFFDAQGRPASNLFGVRPPVLAGFSALDGSGTLDGSSAGTADFILVPSADAAPFGETPYTVGGELQYRRAGELVVITLQPVPIRVLPQPRLTIDYFHQRDVFSDDPHTPELEPAEPYSLAVLLRNTGAGVARNVRLTSGQPRIIDNEKGLFIDFEVLGTERFETSGLHALSPSLAADVGDLASGDRRVLRWLLRSTLQGLFIDYSATFEHVDSLGRPNLSLIDPEGVRIHEMSHLVVDPRPAADKLPDFLVNDQPDPLDLPDTLYLSSGATEPVQLIDSATADAPVSPSHLRVNLTFTPAAGWTYLRIPDPQGGSGPRQYQLVRVFRSDGPVLPAENAWQTDRTFIGLGRRPIRENTLHVLDANATGSLTLVYEPILTPDQQAPATAVTPLPVRVPDQFPVSWTGSDDRGGPPTYDIYVSVDGLPFASWIRGTPLGGAVYPGEAGHRYAFYSVGTDEAGNRELPPAAPDATTSTILTNSPPHLSPVARLVVDEGGSLSVPIGVTDPDLPFQNLSFSLGDGAPPGLRIDPATGLLQWQTGEGNGPSTNRATITVQDDGVPSASDTLDVEIVVREINTAPRLDPVPILNVRKGQTLTYRLVAFDADLPQQPLTFSAGTGAPRGLQVASNTGLMTWSPGPGDGPATNVFSVLVRDAGSPALSNSVPVVIRVREAAIDFTFDLTGLELAAGEPGSVPLQLRPGSALGALEFDLELGGHPLGPLQFRPSHPNLESATLVPRGNGIYAAALSALPSSVLGADAPLGAIRFDAPAPHSGIASLVPRNVTGRSPEGTPLRGGGQAARIVVRGVEPLVDLPSAGQLLIYGVAGRTYQIQARRTIDGSDPWLPLTRTTLTGKTGSVPVAPGPERQFLRAVEE